MNKESSASNNRENQRNKSFSVDFGKLGQVGEVLNLNQVQSYRQALITSDKSTLSLGAGNLKKPYQPVVPQPGSGSGSGTGIGVGNESGNGSEKVFVMSVNIGNNARLNGRYDPFRDRNNVAYHKHMSQNSRPSSSDVMQKKAQEKKGENDQRGNKRQLSPILDGGRADTETDEDDPGWLVATKTGTRRKHRGSNDLQRSTVTPIVIRRRSQTDGQPKKINYVIDSDDNMLVDYNDYDQAAINGEQEMEQESSEGQRDQAAPVDLVDPVIPVIPVVIPGQIGDTTIFHTSRPNGGLRDVLTVECLKLNGEDFKGTITYTEATMKIFQQGLGLSASILHSVKMSFNKCRIVSFKLKKQINIDELVEMENFEMKRSYMQDNNIKTDVISCRIVGIRKPKTGTELPRPNYDGSLYKAVA